MRLVKKSASRPATSTANSRFTEMRCRRSKEARSWFVAGVAATEPICERSASIVPLTQYCEMNVSTTMASTSSDAGRSSAAAERAQIAVTSR